MAYLAVGEATDHHGDGIGLADVREKAVAESLPLGSTGNEAGDIDKLDGRRHRLGRFRGLGQPLQAFVRDRSQGAVGLHRAKRVVFRRRRTVGEGVEQG